MEDDNFDEVEAALLAKFGGGEEDPEAAAAARAEVAEAHEEGHEAGEHEEGEGEHEEGAEGGTETPDEVLAEDSHLVTFKVGEETRKVPVSELRALFDRQEAITKRDTETAETLTRLNAEGEKLVAITQAQLAQAQKDFEPFSKIDFVDARHRLSDEAYNQLRKDAQAAWDRVNFLKQTGENFVQQVRANRAETLKQAIVKRDEALSKSSDIKWDDKTRTDVAAYAEKIGLKGVLDNVDHPAPIITLVKAMLYDKGTAAATKANVKPVATSAPKTPTLRPGAVVTKTAKSAYETAKSRLAQSGSMDDAEAAFLAKFA